MLHKRQLLGLTAGLCLAATSAFGAGFALIEQSVSGLGTAFSNAAEADDPTTVYFNPAGMTLLNGTQAVGALHYISPSAVFHTQTARNVLGGSLGSDSGGNGGKVGYVPNFYATSNLGRVAVGLGINAPFGLATEYNQNWVGRYHAVKSSVRTLNINPAVAVKVGDRLSLGAGFNAQYLDVQLSNRVDFGLASGAAPIASNPNADVYADLTADSWGFGWNLGALFSYSEGGRVGLSYRSQIEHSVEGDADFTVVNPGFLNAVNPALLAAATGFFPDQGVSGDITLPATASLNIYQELTPAWAVTADVTWTEWSSFDRLVINFEQGVGAGLASKQSVTTENWEDNWRYCLGTSYKANDALTLRAGVAYDEGVIPSSTYRTPRIPDEDRFWTAAGFGYKLNDRMNLDFGYVHLFVKDAKMDKIDDNTGENRGRGTVIGEFQNHVDILSAQLVMKF